MDELIKACSDFRSGDYSTLQLWINAYYSTIENAKATYGWDSVVDCINTQTHQKLIKKNILNRFYIARKKNKLGILSQKEVIKNNLRTESEVENNQVKKVSATNVDYPVEFDDYSQLTRSTKITLHKHNLGIHHFNEIGIDNIFDQNIASMKVKDYIKKLSESIKAEELKKHQ